MPPLDIGDIGNRRVRTRVDQSGQVWLKQRCRKRPGDHFPQAPNAAIADRSVPGEHVGSGDATNDWRMPPLVDGNARPRSGKSLVEPTSVTTTEPTWRRRLSMGVSRRDDRRGIRLRDPIEEACRVALGDAGRQERRD